MDIIIPDGDTFTRAEATNIINELYSTDTVPGQEMLRDLLNEMGLAALTDEAVVKLALKHRDE